MYEFLFLNFSVPFEVTCVNGGMYNKERGGCVCPSGFGGSTCKTGKCNFAALNTDTQFIITSFILVFSSMLSACILM
jgi:hypothetical protein